MIYYLIQSYHKEEDLKYKRHIYPCYLTSYNMTVGGDGFGTQLGLHDALKFKYEEDTQAYLDRAEEVFGDKSEFEVVPFDARVFGKVKPKYLVE